MSAYDRLRDVVTDLVGEYGEHLPQEAKDRLKEAGIVFEDEEPDQQLLGLLFKLDKPLKSKEEAEQLYARLKKDFVLNSTLRDFGMDWTLDPNAHVDGWIILDQDGDEVYDPAESRIW